MKINVYKNNCYRLVNKEVVGYLRFPLAPRLAFFWAAASIARRTK